MKSNLKNQSACAVACAAAVFFAAHASAGEVVVVSAKSPVAALTADQVSQLFTAKSTTLQGGGAAVLVDQAEGSPARDNFYAKVTGKNAAQMKALWSRLTFSGAAQPPKVASGDAEVKKAVAETPGAIGYIDKSAVDASVKVVLTLD